MPSLLRSPVDFCAISGVVVTSTQVGATIAWDVTPTATGQLLFGTSAALGSSSGTVTYQGHHSFDLAGLQPGTTYHYRCVSIASDGHRAEAVGTFTTAAPVSVSDAAAATETSRIALSAVETGAAAEVASVSTSGVGASSGIEAGITYTDVFIPSSIDDTGATDVSAALQTFIANLSNVPNGSSTTAHIRVRPNSPLSIYRISGDFNAIMGLQLKGSTGAKRQHITFWGEGRWSSFPLTSTAPADSTYRSTVESAYSVWNRDDAWIPGATIRRVNGGASSSFNAVFFTENCDDIQVCGWTLDGMNTQIGVAGTAGQLTTGLPQEHTMAITVRAGSTNIRFHDNRVIRWNGFVYLGNNLGSGSVSPSGVVLSRNYIEGGEMQLAPVDSAGFEAYHNVFKEAGLIWCDIEPESTSVQCDDINLHHNIIEGWGIAHWYQTCWWLAANGAGASGINVPIRRLTITDNYVPRGQVRGTLTNGGSGKGGLALRANKVNPKDDWVIERNWTAWADQQNAGSGRAYNFVATGTDITYRDNIIPMTGTLDGSSATPEDYLFNWRRDSDNVVDRFSGVVTVSGNVT